MKRPTAVRVAAILLMSVSLLWICDFIFVTHILIHHGLVPSFQNPRFVRLLVNWGLVLAVSSWGIVTSIGILRLRAWARISIIALGIMAAYHFLGLVLASPLSRAWNSPIGVRIWLLGLVLAYFGCGGLAALMIAAFASERMDKFFPLHAEGTPPAEKAEGPAPTLAKSRAELAPQRSLSALVIGAWLLCAGPLVLYQDLLHLPVVTLPLPPYPLGFILRAHGTVVYHVLMAAAVVALGLGLLKGNYYWARRGTIAFCIFSIVSQLAAALRPEYVAFVAKQLPDSASAIHVQAALWLLTSWTVVPPAITIYLLAKRRLFFPGQPREVPAGGTEIAL